MKITRKRLEQLINESIADLNGDMDEACGPSMPARQKKKIAIIKLAEDDDPKPEPREEPLPAKPEETGGRGREGMPSAKPGPRPGYREAPNTSVMDIVRTGKTKKVMPDVPIEEYDDFTGQMKGGGKITDIYENLDLRQFVSDVIYSLLNEDAPPEKKGTWERQPLTPWKKKKNKKPSFEKMPLTPWKKKKDKESLFVPLEETDEAPDGPPPATPASYEAHELSHLLGLE